MVIEFSKTRRTWSFHDAVLQKTTPKCTTIKTHVHSHRSGSGCPKSGLRYPPDKSLSSINKNKARYPLDKDLSSEQCYPPFENSGPGVILDGNDYHTLLGMFPVYSAVTSKTISIFYLIKSGGFESPGDHV